MANKFESIPFQNPIESEKTKEIPEQFDALVVLGQNWREHPPGKEPEKFKLRLSLEGKMSSLAAGEMFRAGLVDKIIVSGGRTVGQEYSSESEEMAKYLKKKYPDIPEEAIILEERSIDTAENAELVAEIIRNNPALQKLALVTTDVHLPRSEKLFREFGLEITPFPTEELLKKRSPHYEHFVESYLKSNRTKIEKIKELILRSLLYVDVRGRIPRLLTKKLRGSE